MQGGRTEIVYPTLRVVHKGRPTRAPFVSVVRLGNDGNRIVGARPTGTNGCARARGHTCWQYWQCWRCWQERHIPARGGSEVSRCGPWSSCASLRASACEEDCEGIPRFHPAAHHLRRPPNGWRHCCCNLARSAARNAPSPALIGPRRLHMIRPSVPIR